MREMRSVVLRDRRIFDCSVFAVLLAAGVAHAQTKIKVYRPLDFIIGDSANGNNWKSLADYQAWWNARAESSFQACMAKPKQYGYGWQCDKVTIAGFDPFRGSPYEIYYNGHPYWSYIQREDYRISVSAEGISEPVITHTVCSAYGGGFCGTWAAFANPICPRPTSRKYTLLGSSTDSAKYYDVTCESDIEGEECGPVCTVGSPDNLAKPPLVGNPINPAVPEKIHREVDYQTEGGRFALTRHYRGSKRKWAGIVNRLVDFTPERRDLTPKIETFWLSANSVTFLDLRFEEIPSSTSEVHVSRPNGVKLFAKDNANGTFSSSDNGSLVRRFALPGGDFEWHLWSRENTLEVFRGSDGRHASTVHPDGYVINYSYPDASTIETTSVRSGRKMVIEMDPQGAMRSATLPDGSKVEYSTENSLYKTVRFPDSTSKAYFYDEVAHTGGEPLRDLGNLTGLQDELGVRVGTYQYEKYSISGTVKSTEQAGGVGKFSVSATGTYSRVTDPLGAETLYYWVQTGDQMKKLESIRQPAGSGSTSSSKRFAFAANGNLTRVDDFNGRRTCFGSDAGRNLEVVRIEGLTTAADCSGVTPANATLPAGSRKTTTEWHSAWRLRTRVAEPGRVTTYVYNGQADPFANGATASCAPADALLPDGKPIAVLCRQVEQATTDANGSQGFNATLQSGVPAREERWTYNRWGQVLTHDGPRTDVNDITTYVYYSDTSFTGSGAEAAGHTQGDLQSVTNAAGQVTQNTKYDKHGQLLESIGPNGVVTTHTYDLRQRLLSTTEAGQTTTYTYDAAGQLTRITWSDASYLGYEYDPAHRQTAVFDHLGNRIEYTLDNAGNRIAENVKDPGGLLSRQLSRSIDALGRVQQITGRE